MVHKKEKNILLPALIIGFVVIGAFLYIRNGNPVVEGLLGKTQTTQEKAQTEKKVEEEGDHQEYNEPVTETAVHVVDIYSDRFEPSTISVSINETVAWKNEDTIPHRVAADDGGFDTGEINVMQQLSAVSYSEPGTYTYTSKTRPSLKGIIIVTE